MTADTWAGNYRQPLTLNKWLYTNGNPVNFTDPSGHCVGPAVALCAAVAANPEIWIPAAVIVGTAFLIWWVVYGDNVSEGVGQRAAQLIEDNCDWGTPQNQPDGPEPGDGYPWLKAGVGLVAIAAFMANAATGGSSQTVGQPHLVPTPQPTPGRGEIFYHGTTSKRVDSIKAQMEAGTFGLADPEIKVWGRGEFGVGFYTTRTRQEAIPWAYDAVRYKGGDPVVIAIEVPNFDDMEGLYLNSQDMFDDAKFGKYDVGPDYLWGMVVGSAQRGVQFKFNKQAFPELRWVGIVMWPKP